MSQLGKLIVIEGADGAGKATQTKQLVERLRNEGREVETMDFPQYERNVFGKLIGECLSGDCESYMELDAKVAATLFAVDRFESKGQLEKWLSEGKVVILDRYVTANMIHQGARTSSTAELDELFSWIEKVEYEIFGIPRPDHIIYLDVPAEERRHLSREAGKNDVADRNLSHQVATDKVSEYAAKKFKWNTIHCMKDGRLCSIEDIAKQVYNQTVQFIQS